MQHIDDTSFARHFKALAHPRRVRIFRLLIECPETGRSFTSLHMAAHLCPSSLAHHLREMERCGLVRRQRKGINVRLTLETARFATTLADALRLAGSMHPQERLAA